MQTIDLEEVIKNNPHLDRMKIEEAVALIKSILLEGIAESGSCERDPFGRRSGVSLPPGEDPRTVKLRVRL